VNLREELSAGEAMHQPVGHPTGIAMETLSSHQGNTARLVIPMVFSLCNIVMSLCIVQRDKMYICQEELESYCFVVVVVIVVVMQLFEYCVSF
jgi:hypothetical protein